MSYFSDQFTLLNNEQKKMPQIRYLKNEQIDKTRWDLAIASSVNRSVYGLSWYLDIVSPGWEALIEGDYQNLFPLPVHRKLGLNYLAKPLLCQKLGLFSKELDADVLPYLNIVKKKFLFADINLDTCLSAPEMFNSQRKRNQYIDLNNSYQEIQKRYSGKSLKKVVKGLPVNLEYSENIDVDEFLFLYFSNSPFKVTPKFKTITTLIVENSIDTNQGFISGILVDNKLETAIFWLKSFGRIILLLNFTTDKGRESQANYYSINEFIKCNASTNYILDFEGSSIESIARFNKNFGTIDEFYEKIFISRIPGLETILKLL